MHTDANNSNGSFEPLAGAHALVTGGGRGIGFAVVMELAARGANVTVCGRTRAKLDLAADAVRGRTGRSVESVACDVTDASAVASMFERVAERLGAPDIVVNNAGGAESAPLARTDDAMWRRMIELNLTSVFNCCRAAVPGMIDAGRGRIINIASTAGLRGFPYVSAYAAAKHGVVGLTRALAIELGKHGVTVNAVCPAYTDTELIERSAAAVAERTGRTVESIRAEYAAANPGGRLVEPAEVAQAVAWLCLPNQAGLSGEAIEVDGTGSGPWQAV